MPTQEGSHLTWDFHQEQPRKIKILNENFLLTSANKNKGFTNSPKELKTSENKNEDRSLDDHFNDFLAPSNKQHFMGSALSSLKETDYFQNKHEGNVAKLLKKTTYAERFGRDSVFKSFNPRTLFAQKSTPSLCNMGMLLSSLQKQKTMDPQSKEIQEFYLAMKGNCDQVRQSSSTLIAH